MYALRFVFSAIAVAVLSAAAATPRMASAAETYYGTATLCAVDMSEVSFETKGKNGVTYTYNQVLVFRIDTDHELINGWEVLTSNNKVAPSKVEEGKESKGGYYWGDAVLAPDLGGTLVDNFKFPVAQADSISGTYYGADGLEGAVVDYALTPAGMGELPLDACTDMSWDCQAPGCIALPSGIAGYFMNGQVISE